MDVGTTAKVHTVQYCAMRYWPIVAERTAFVADVREVANINCHEYSSNWKLFVAEKVSVSSSEVPLILDQQCNFVTNVSE